MKRLVVWCAGYSQGSVTTAPVADLEQLRKVGAAVLFAAAFAALEWAFASTGFATDAPLWARIILAVCLGGLAAGIVIVFDRAAMYLLDVRTGQRSAFWFQVIRVVMVATFATLTAERVVQIVLKPEMAAQALFERERNEVNRQTALNAQYQVPEADRQVGVAEAETLRLEEESRTTPPLIQAELDRAIACRRTVGAERKRLRRLGYDQRRINRTVASQAQSCRKIGTDAQTDLRDWRADVAQRVDAARDSTTDARNARTNARTAVNERVAEARAIEQEAIQPGSVSLLARTIFNSPSALFMAIACFVMSLSVQLLPFALKYLAEPTAVGRGLVAEREIAILGSNTRLARADDEALTEIAASRAVQEASIAAMGRPDVRARMETEAAEGLKMRAPINEAVRTFRKILSAKQEMDSMVAGVDEPGLAVLGHRLWTNAICQLEGHDADADAVGADDAADTDNAGAESPCAGETEELQPDLF